MKVASSVTSLGRRKSSLAAVTTGGRDSLLPEVKAVQVQRGKSSWCAIWPPAGFWKVSVLSTVFLFLIKVEFHSISLHTLIAFCRSAKKSTVSDVWKTAFPRSARITREYHREERELSKNWGKSKNSLLPFFKKLFPLLLKYQVPYLLRIVLRRDGLSPKEGALENGNLKWSLP